MPRYKKYRGYKRTYKKKARRTPKVNITKAIEAYFAKQIETKTNDVAVDTVLSNSNLIVEQPCPTQGTASYNRIGEQIDISSHYLLFQWSQAVLTPDTHNVMRIIFLCDRLSKNSTFSLSELLQNSGPPLNMISPLLKESAGRFKIILDKTYTINDSGNQSLQKKFYINFKKPKRQKYTTNSGTVADILEDTYYIVFIGDSSTPPHTTLRYHWRMNYKDA